MKILKPGKHRLFEQDFETAKIVAEMLSDLGILCFNVAQVFSPASLFHLIESNAWKRCLEDLVAPVWSGIRTESGGARTLFPICRHRIS